MLSERSPSPSGSVRLQRRQVRSLFAASPPEEAGRWAPPSHVTLSQDGGLKGGWENNPEISNPTLLFSAGSGFNYRPERSEKPKKENRLL